MKLPPLSEVVILVPSMLANLNSSFFLPIKPTSLKEPKGRIRSMGIEKAKTNFSFIHWCGMQSLVIDFLKFQYAVKCCISLIMLRGH
ncbi:hypothetical protein V6N13_009223 [Hibiscus sabdariffa]